MQILLSPCTRTEYKIILLKDDCWRTLPVWCARGRHQQLEVRSLEGVDVGKLGHGHVPEHKHKASRKLDLWGRGRGQGAVRVEGAKVVVVFEDQGCVCERRKTAAPELQILDDENG